MSLMTIFFFFAISNPILLADTANHLSNIYSLLWWQNLLYLRVVGSLLKKNYLLQTSLKLEINMKHCSVQWNVSGSCWIRFLGNVLNRIRLFTQLFALFSSLGLDFSHDAWKCCYHLATLKMRPHSKGGATRRQKGPEAIEPLSRLRLPTPELVPHSNYFLSLCKPFSEGFSVTRSRIYLWLIKFSEHPGIRRE